MCQAIGLYLHVPFCRRKCAYCDFNSHAGLEGLVPEYVPALVREMELWSDQALVATTLYIGGGTPSLLSGEQLDMLIQAAGRRFGLSEGAEVSIEANPGTADKTWFQTARRLGVSRVSLGVQSFRDDELRLLGRIHSGEEARSAFAAARQAGFDNVNLDLIYGLPGQTLCRWQRTLDGALHLAPEHLSLYSLTLEEGTPLARQVARGDAPAPDPDQAADMYQWAEEVLGRAGYVHYEISNWSRESGKECQHNLIYWRNRPYLGLGAGAHSSWGGYRFHNTAQPADYVRQVAGLCAAHGGPWDILHSRSPIAGAEAIPVDLEMAETVILGLRLVEGVSLGGFLSRFGVELAGPYGQQVQELQGLGLVEVSDGCLRLTRRGWLLGNEAFWRFLPQ
ncbi:MAG: radical SAM family heme chaperone HemW [Chloroflexi bacterium]|nr:radical SAM family heme chaperone HemW [Chloroflexota bacterium]